MSCGRWWVPGSLAAPVDKLQRAGGLRGLFVHRCRRDRLCSYCIRLPHDDPFLRKAIAGLAGLRIEPISLAGLGISATRRRHRLGT